MKPRLMGLDAHL